MQPRASASFQTEVEFTLPKGYLDATGILHRKGIMRLATAADEILPLRDPRVQQNEAYLAIIILARVITKLGDVADIDTKLIEGLFACDLDYLQRLYERINGSDDIDSASDTIAAPHAGMRASVAPTQKGFRTMGEA